MYVVTTTYERASPATPYYIDSNPDLKASFIAFMEVYASLVSEFNVDNATPTTQIGTVAYVDEATFQEFINHFNEFFPTFFADRDAYCAANNISITRSVGS